VLEAEVSPL